MNFSFWVFLGVMLLMFALVLLFLGMLTAYFGSGKSRKVGVILTIVGLLVAIVWITYRWYSSPGEIINKVILPALFYVGAAIIGAIIAFAAFIAAIMKV